MRYGLKWQEYARQWDKMKINAPRRKEFERYANQLIEHKPQYAAIEEGTDILSAPWRTEYDVISTLTAIGHEVKALGVHDDLAPTPGEHDGEEDRLRALRRAGDRLSGGRARHLRL